MATSIGTLKAYVGADITGLQTGMGRARRVVRNATGDINRSIGRTSQSLISMNKLFAAGVFATGGALLIRRTAGAFVQTAASFEKMRIQLDALTDGRGTQTLEEINEWALEMPVNTQSAVAAFVRMQAFGLDPTIEKMQILTDVASIFGDEVLGRVSRALGQMAALGKLSAEELNQLSEVGINARRYLKEAFGTSVEEFQRSGMAVEEAINAIWEGMEREFGGSAERMMDSWQGLIATTQSYITEIQRVVAGAGAFDALKEAVGELNQELQMWLETNEEIIEQKMPEYVGKLKSAVEGTASALASIVSIYDKIPDEVKSAAFGGIIGRLLLGKKAAGTVALLVGLDATMRSISREIEVMGQKREIGLLPDIEQTNRGLEASQNLWDVLTGKVDWWSGVSKKAMSRVTEEFDEMHEGWAMAESDVEDFGYTLRKEMADAERAMQGLDAVIESVFAPIDKARDNIAKLQAENIWEGLEPPEEKLAEWEQLELDLDMENARRWHDEWSAILDDVNQRAEDTQRQLDMEQLSRRDMGVDIALDDYFGEIDDAEDRLKQSTDWMVDLTQNTAELMQSNFSNVFFDAMTNELKSLEDYSDAIFKSMARAASDMLSKLAVESLFGAIGGASGAGGIGGIIGSLFGEAHHGMIVGQQPIPRLHSGLAHDEYPAILQRGEEVRSRGQVQRDKMDKDKKPGNTINYNITIPISAPDGRLPTESMNQMQSALWGTLRRSSERNN